VLAEQPQPLAVPGPLLTAAPMSVGVVVDEPTTTVFGNPFFAELIKGISAALARRSASMVLLMPNSSRTFEHDAEFLCGGHLRGAVLVSLHSGSSLLDRLVENRLPMVVQGNPPDGYQISSVDIDNRGAGATAVGHLLSLGRRRIATIAGDLALPSAVERLEGYRDALRASAVTPDQSLEEAGHYQADAAHLAMERLLLAHPDIDGVFAASDLMARSAMAVLTRAGRRIPEDVAVIGFDDSAVARACRPALSSIRQPTEAMGRETIALLERILAEPPATPARVILTSQLVVRESTAGAGGR
jgi:DNA-binding LacI/PurR family transcriptional regulator